MVDIYSDLMASVYILSFSETTCGGYEATIVSTGTETTLSLTKYAFEVHLNLYWLKKCWNPAISSINHELNLESMVYNILPQLIAHFSQNSLDMENASENCYLVLRKTEYFAISRDFSLLHQTPDLWKDCFHYKSLSYTASLSVTTINWSTLLSSYSMLSVFSMRFRFLLHIIQYWCTVIVLESLHVYGRQQNTNCLLETVPLDGIKESVWSRSWSSTFYASLFSVFLKCGLFHFNVLFVITFIRFCRPQHQVIRWFSRKTINSELHLRWIYATEIFTCISSMFRLDVT